mgnify:CR=1 FL=1
MTVEIVEIKKVQKIKILVINHVPEVDLGSYEEFINSDRHYFERFYFSSLKNPPSVDKYDALWVMGGPMNVWEENRYPWLVQEKLFIKNWVLNLEKPFFGICLGMQCAVIEYMRNILGKKDASTTEIDKTTLTPIIDLMDNQKQIRDKGGSMRLGSYECKIIDNTINDKCCKKYDYYSEKSETVKYQATSALAQAKAKENYATAKKRWQQGTSL